LQLIGLDDGKKDDLDPHPEIVDRLIKKHPKKVKIYLQQLNKIDSKLLIFVKNNGLVI